MSTPTPSTTSYADRADVTALVTTRVREPGQVARLAESRTRPTGLVGSTGRLMLVPHAVQDGYLAATNAVQGRGTTLSPPASPIGSFTDPEYAQVGLNEAQARRDHDVVVASVPLRVAAIWALPFSSR